MGKIGFQIIGGYVLSLAAGVLIFDVLWMGHFSLRFSQQVRPMDILWSAIGEAVLILTGVGLLLLRKWAALTVSAFTLFAAFGSFREAIRGSSIPGDWTWLGYLYGALLMVPTLLTAKCWKILVWRSSKRSSLSIDC